MGKQIKKKSSKKGSKKGKRIIKNHSSENSSEYMRELLNTNTTENNIKNMLGAPMQPQMMQPQMMQPQMMQPQMMQPQMMQPQMMQPQMMQPQMMQPQMMQPQMMGAPVQPQMMEMDPLHANSFVPMNNMQNFNNGNLLTPEQMAQGMGSIANLSKLNLNQPSGQDYQFSEMSQMNMAPPMNQMGNINLNNLANLYSVKQL
jgi:hypothetical protein